ncbi:MAG: cytochrome c [Deinococcales bacterium]
MVVPIYSHVVSPPEASGGGSTAQAAGPPVDQALLKAGDTLYASDCAACHKQTGEGMPPTFPALAGNSFLSDASAVVKKVFEGGGAMPSHPSYTAKDLAAVATYIRNTWGNSYGGVSVADAASAEPKASNPASTPATGTATSTATSTASSPATGTATSTSTSTATSTASSPATSTSTSTSTAAPAGQAAGAGTQALMSAGKTLYDSDCASCHQPNGAGIPPTFPALAGNAFLSDAAAVVQRVFDGKGTMPPHPSYTAKDLAAVATYVRNAFGNSYGAVTLQEASQAAPKASQ